MVLADGGVCCIDEFGCVKEKDKASIHEAMEQQTLSVAKAGISCKLHTRCSVFAAQNPKLKVDPGTKTLSEVTGIGAPLLSRFDLILLMHDTRSDVWDRTVTAHVLSRLPTAMGEAAHEAEQRTASDAQTYGTVVVGSSQSNGGRGALSQVVPSNSSTSHGNNPLATFLGESLEQRKKHTLEAFQGAAPLPMLTFEEIQSYITFVRALPQPPLTRAANRIIRKYYAKQRSDLDGLGALLTVRMLESLVRLAQVSDAFPIVELCHSL